MHIEYLYYFKDFSETLSMSKAAAKNYMTPQGLSRAIHQLEKDFGIRLTSYQGNEISLTPAGQELSKRVDDVLTEFEHLKGVLLGYRLAEINNAERRGRSSVRVTITPCVSQYVANLLDLQKPGLFEFEVKCKESNLYRIAPHLVAREDEEALGLISFPALEKYRNMIAEMCESSSMIYEPLFTSPLVALVSAYSPLAKKGIVRPSDTNEYAVARFQDTVLGDALDDYIREESVKTVTNATSIISSRILEDHAISFAPELIKATDFLPDTVKIISTEGFFETEFGIMYPSIESDSEHIRKVIDYLHQKLRQEAGSNRYGNIYKLCID